MTGLLETREYLRSFYAKNEIYVNPILKFLIALISLMIINGTMGYMALLKNPVVVLVIALMCSFMPKNFVVLIGIKEHIKAITNTTTGFFNNAIYPMEPLIAINEIKATKNFKTGFI